MDPRGRPIWVYESMHFLHNKIVYGPAFFGNKNGNPAFSRSMLIKSQNRHPVKSVKRKDRRSVAKVQRKIGHQIYLVLERINEYREQVLHSVDNICLYI